MNGVREMTRETCTHPEHPHPGLDVCVKAFSAARQPRRGWIEREKSETGGRGGGGGGVGSGKTDHWLLFSEWRVGEMDECHSVSASIWTWCVSSVGGQG